MEEVSSLGRKLEIEVIGGRSNCGDTQTCSITGMEPTEEDGRS